MHPKDTSCFTSSSLFFSFELYLIPLPLLSREKGRNTNIISVLTPLLKERGRGEANEKRGAEVRQTNIEVKGQALVVNNLPPLLTSHV